jgi:SSS family transporter
MQSALITVSLIYFALVIGISIWGYRKTRTEVDFLAAGRTIGPLVGGAVLAATQISAGTYVGTFGRHYLAGISWFYVWGGMWTGWLISAIWVAPRLRSFGALTVPDYIAVRFNSEVARILSALLIIVSYTIYLVAQFQASGEIARTVFGTSPLVGMLMIIASTTVYTFLGGVKGSSYVEFVQALIMTGGLLIAVPVLLHLAGGVHAAWTFLGAIDRRLTGMYYGWRELIGYGVAFGFSIAAAPYTITRFYSMRDEKTARRAIGVSLLFQFLIGSSVLVLGMLMRVLFPYLGSPDQASSVMAFRVLTPLAGSLVLVAMISAIMSTCNSVLLVAGAGFAHDIYAKLLRPRSGDQHLVWVNRWSALALSVLPAYFALQKYTDVQSIVIVQAKLMASFFFVPVVFGLNWKRATAPGAIAAMFSGFATCLASEALLQTWLTARGLDSVEIGVAVSLLIFTTVSCMTRPVRAENLQIFFGG